MPHVQRQARPIAFKETSSPTLVVPYTTLSSRNNLFSPQTYTMASRAIPSHLKPSAAEGGEGGFSSQRHHGKSQSHVVSTLSLCFCSCPACVLLFPALLACIGFVAAQRTQLSSPLPVVSTWVWWGPRRAGIERPRLLVDRNTPFGQTSRRFPTSGRGDPSELVFAATLEYWPRIRIAYSPRE